MSNNAPDYEDNLVFPPQEIKSQDDIKHQETRSSDVLLEAIEKCEKLETENQQLKEILYKCREKLDELDYGCEVWQGELTGFIDEIDNVIGEKKCIK